MKLNSCFLVGQRSCFRGNRTVSRYSVINKASSVAQSILRNLKFTCKKKKWMCDNIEVTQVFTQDRNVGLSWTSSHNQAISDLDVPPALTESESGRCSTPLASHGASNKNKSFHEVYSGCADPQSWPQLCLWARMGSVMLTPKSSSLQT